MGNTCCSRMKDDCLRLYGYDSIESPITRISAATSTTDLPRYSKSSKLSDSLHNSHTTIDYSSMFLSPVHSPNTSDIIQSISSSNDSIYSNSEITSSTELEVA
jgi:hypothetical protein